MNLDYLTTFLEVVRTGSFSEVAKKLSITQPAVSFQIHKLERDLGVRLLDRQQKTLTMTDAGRRLLRFAETIEKERASLIQDLEQLREQITGDIVIIASTIPGEILLPSILGEFKAMHPAIGARVDISDSMAVISKVQEGKYDVGFCGVKPESRELDYFKIAEDEIVLAVFPEHPFARRKDISPQELDGEFLLIREETSGTQQSLKSRLAEAGISIERWPSKLVLGTTQAMVSAVEARVGIAFVSNLAIRKSLALGLIKEVAIKGIKLKRDFYCVYRRERVVSRLLAEFLTFMQARAA